VKSLREQISNVARSRRQCDGELRRALVEARMDSISQIFLAVQDQKDKVITIPVSDKLKSYKRLVDGSQQNKSASSTQTGFKKLWESVVQDDERSYEEAQEFESWYRDTLVKYFKTIISTNDHSSSTSIRYLI
jgi:hypothetical protein